MPSSDDIIVEANPYSWSQRSKLSLQDFLAKYKPSMVRNDGTKPWLWVSRSDSPVELADEVKAEEEGKTLLKEITEKIETIQNDDSIPLRTNKKKGTKSKKELREVLHAEASEKLKDISIKYKYVCGKWLIFATPDKVDAIWSTIAASLIEGPLASTSAYHAKVATSPLEETAHYQHLLCVYMPDVYDKDSVTEVMKVLLRRHGMNLMGVKSDLYTAIGLDSKHPSGIPSTVWKNIALMKDTEIKDLRDQYFKELAASKTAAAAEKATEKETNEAALVALAKSKPKFKLKKRSVDDDPFASDEEPQEKAKPTISKPTHKPKEAQDQAVEDERSKINEDANEDEDEQERAIRLAALKTKSAKSASNDTRKRQKVDDPDDEAAEEEDDERLRKKRDGKKKV